MPKINIRTIIPLAALFLFASGSVAGAQQGSVDLNGTDSAGSYSHDAAEQAPAATHPGPGAAAGKAEGSKGKMHPGHPPMHPHGKSEGIRPYAHKEKECDKEHPKKEGSGHPGGYAHGDPHGKSGHGIASRGHGGHGGHGKNPFEHVIKFKGKLGLTAEQIEAMKEAEFEYKKERVQAKAEHKIAHMELEKLAHSGNVDEAAMRAVATRIAASKTRSIHAMVEAKIALLKILTPEQRQKMTAMHSAH
jgi:Spy/CpxP family protein refolding chaperone